MDRLNAAAIGATAVLGVLLGLAIGWAIWAGALGPESPKPQKVQADGSLVLKREPALPEQLPPAPHTLPKKGREERRVSVTVQPKEQACAPVSVDLSLVRLDDGSARVVASSPDGKVFEGLDVAIVKPSGWQDEGPRKWAAGITWSGDNALGVAVHRDLWRFRFGLEVGADRDGDAEARLVAAWTW